MDSIWSRHLVHGVWKEATHGLGEDQRTRWYTELKEEPSVDLNVITMSRIERFIDICVTVLLRGLESNLGDGVDGVPGIGGYDLLRDV